jgi:hypothetical protein
VGSQGLDPSSRTAFAQAWDGQRWTIQATPGVTGLPSSTLQSVSCPAADSCTAVGDSEDPSRGALTLAERWDGSAWTITASVDPAGNFDNFLFGVSCTSATSCVAVGGWRTIENVYGLVELWNGASWTATAAPSPDGAVNSVLNAVSCTTATACTAVGNYDTSTGMNLPLVERWDGATWTVESVPNPVDSVGSFLYGVSCPTTTSCVAVGQYFTSDGDPTSGPAAGQVLTETWDGTTWTQHPVPNLDAYVISGFNSVSCTSAVACVAVGADTTPANPDALRPTLAGTWDGTTWTVQTVPAPADFTDGQLLSVSCSTATACMAVGSSFADAGFETLTESWDGAAWTTVPSPTPNDDAGLIGISCTAPSACVAVGGYRERSNAVLTLAEVWNGAIWTTDPTPNPPGGLSNLESVSCQSATTCTAVGEADQPFVPLAMARS